MKLEPYPVRLREYQINHYNVTIFNHFGTHIDGPNHFNPSGARIADLPFDFFIFDRVVLVDIPKDDEALITGRDLEVQGDQIREAELLLIKTGYGRYRSRDPHRYATRFPGLGVDAGEYIVEKLTRVRAIGIDTISIGSYAHLEQALKVHSVLAAPSNRGRHIVNIEDLNLEESVRSFRRVAAVPLPIEGVDSAPAVVIAEVDS
jgi:arylformamidase